MKGLGKSSYQSRQLTNVKVDIFAGWYTPLERDRNKIVLIISQLDV